MIDVFTNTVERHGDSPLTVAWTDYIPVLDHGFVRLEASLACDLDPVNSARVSFGGRRSELDNRDRGLINFLARERHGSPFEHSFLRFEVKAPIFVFREWHRHRIGVSINEASARYMQLDREFYIPDVSDFRVQRGKPGAYYFEPDDVEGRPEQARAQIESSCNHAFDAYESMLSAGVAKEIARVVLPVNTYSTMWYSMNPRSLMSFLSLRNAANAQAEIRSYAEVMEEIARKVMPATFDSFVANGRISP